MSNFKKIAKILADTFAKHCSTGLFTSKFHILYHIFEDLLRFGTLYVLQSGWFEDYNMHIKTVYYRTLRCMNKGMEETVKGLLLCDKRDEMGCTSIQAVNSAGIWKTQDPSGRLLVEERHFAWHGEELTIREIQAGIDGVYIGNRKDASPFSHLL